MADLNGFVKIYRQIIKWGWYRDIPVKVLFLHCLFMANYQEAKWYGVTVGRGSFITSIDELSQQTGLTVQNTRTALKKLISTGEIAKKSTNKCTVITVVNYDKFQENRPTSKNGYKSVNELLISQKSNINSNKQINKGFNNVENYEKSAQQDALRGVENLPSTNKSTSKLTKTLTNEQQTANNRPTSQLTTNKEVKEIKNINNTKNIKNITNLLTCEKRCFDFSEYTEKEMTNLFPNTTLTVAEYDVLFKYVKETALNRYCEKIKQYTGCKNQFETILKWAADDNQLKVKI